MLRGAELTVRVRHSELPYCGLTYHFTPGGVGAKALAERFLEGGGGQGFKGEVEHVAVGAKPFEGPDKVSLGGDAQGAAGGDDAEQNAGR
jgi:hypothetical protein